MTIVDRILEIHSGGPISSPFTINADGLLELATELRRLRSIESRVFSSKALEEQGNTILDQRNRIEKLERAAGDAAIREAELREAHRIDGDTFGSLQRKAKEDAVVRADLLKRLEELKADASRFDVLQGSLEKEIVALKSDLKVAQEERAEIREAHDDLLRQVGRLEIMLSEARMAPALKIDAIEIHSAETTRLQNRINELRGAIIKVDKELHEGLNKGWVDVLKIIRPILLRALDPARPRLAGQEELLNPTSLWALDKPDLRAQVEETIARIKATGGLEPQDRPHNNVEFLAMRLFNAEKERDELKAELVRMWGVDIVEEIPKLRSLAADLGALNQKQRKELDGFKTGTSYQRLERQRASAENTAKTISEENGRLAAVNETLEKEARKYASEIATLRSLVAKLEAWAPAAERTQLRVEVEQLRDEVRNWKREAEGKTKQLENYRELFDVVRRLRKGQS